MYGIRSYVDGQSTISCLHIQTASATAVCLVFGWGIHIRHLHAPLALERFVLCTAASLFLSPSVISADKHKCVEKQSVFFIPCVYRLTWSQQKRSLFMLWHLFSQNVALNGLLAKNLANSWQMKDQLDVTCYFISLIMCSTCFRH